MAGIFSLMVQWPEYAVHKLIHFIVHTILLNNFVHIITYYNNNIDDFVDSCVARY